MKNLLHLIILLIVCAGCTPMNSIYQSAYFTKITYDECFQPLDEMYVFFDGEELNFKFTKIGIISIEAEKDLSHKEVFDRFKYLAWQQCANGIIFTEYHQKTMKLSDAEPQKVHVFEGLAVKINIDSVFVENYGDELDMAFINNVEEWDQLAAEELNDARTAGASFVGLLLSIGLLTLAGWAEVQ